MAKQNLYAGLKKRDCAYERAKRYTEGDWSGLDRARKLSPLVYHKKRLGNSRGRGDSLC